MGNCCGTQSSSDDNFRGQGRTLDGAASANAPPSSGNARAAVPPKISSPRGGKSLGANPQVPAESEGPKAAAARAAEERAKASSQGKGKLGRQLDAQKSQTQSEALAQNARDAVAARDADTAAQTRSYN